jgi:hypothetical protein
MLAHHGRMFNDYDTRGFGIWIAVALRWRFLHFVYALNEKVAPRAGRP